MTERPTPTLLEQFRHRIRFKHYSIRTEDAYVQFARRFILFHGKRHPREMGADEIRQFLSRLATEGNVSASTQNQALAAILFLYKEVLGIEPPAVEGVMRAKRPARVPVVLTRGEVASVLSQLSGTYHTMAAPLYGAGLRLMECVRLRAKDVDFGYMQITVRDGKGEKTAAPFCPKPSPSRCGSSSRGPNFSTRKTCGAASGASSCPTRSSANTRTPGGNGAGSGCSPRRVHLHI